MIRNILLYSLVCVLGLFIQGAFVKSLFPGAIAPDFLLIIVVVLSVRHPDIWGVFGAFAIGLAGDFAVARFVGPSAAGSVTAFLVVRFFATKLYAERGFALAALTFIASIAKSLINLLMLLLYVNVNLFTGEGWKIILVEAMLSALVAPWVFVVLEKRRASTAS